MFVDLFYFATLYGFHWSCLDFFLIPYLDCCSLFFSIDLNKERVPNSTLFFMFVTSEFHQVCFNSFYLTGNMFLLLNNIITILFIIIRLIKVEAKIWIFKILKKNWQYSPKTVFKLVPQIKSNKHLAHCGKPCIMSHTVAPKFNVQPLTNSRLAKKSFLRVFLFLTGNIFFTQGHCIGLSFFMTKMLSNISALGC